MDALATLTTNPQQAIVTLLENDPGLYRSIRPGSIKRTCLPLKPGATAEP